MITMYPGKVNSPATELDGGINDAQTTISLVDVSVLPDAPNLAVIGRDEDAETISYAAKAGNDLTGCTREFQGTAKAWDSGTFVGRMFTAYDYDTLRTNVGTHDIATTGVHGVGASTVDSAAARDAAIAAVKLGDLADVSVGIPINGTMFYWDAATSLWKCIPHAALTSGVHGVGAGTIAEVADIAVDANLSAAGQDAIAKKHIQNTDTDLDATFEATFVKHSLATAVSDFLVASGAGVFIKKTLAEVKTILGLGTAAYTAATDYVTHALATAANDFLVASGSGAFVKKTLAEVKTILGITNVEDTAHSTDAHTMTIDGRDVSADGTKLDNVVSNTQAITHAITDNKTVTVDGSPNDDEFARFTANGLEGLTVAEAITALLGTALPENVAIILDPALSADGKYSGIVEAGTAGATLAFGDLVYLQTADSRWELAGADNGATGHNFKLGICVLAAAGDASATAVLLFGKVRADTAFPALTIGAPVYMGTTVGDIVTAAPSGTTDIVRIMGYGNTADELYFCPENDWITLV